MVRLLRKWFGNTPRSGAGAVSDDVGEATAAVAATTGVREDEEIQALYEEFGRTFCHRPGVNFMAFLRAEGVTRMIDWLHPSTPCALPKGFIRLAVDATRKGSRFWETREPIRMYYEGNWNQGGLPGRESLDALSVLAQILDKSITLYYTPKQGGDLMVMTFDP